MLALQKKVCLLGDFAVGKTSLIRRYVEGKFEDKYLSTVGINVSRRSIALQHNSITLDMTMLIWDLAGGEKFDRMMSSYYRGATGAIIVCDLTRQETLEAIMRYANDFWSVNPNTPLVVVGNKADLVEACVITAEDLTLTAKRCEAPYFVSSAKTGENVERIFDTLGYRILAAD
jgi:small GTP-binding protein